MIVPRRALPKATQRNRLKRLVREAVRLRGDLRGWDLLMLAHSGIQTRDLPALRAQIAKPLEALAAKIAQREAGRAG